MTDERQWWEIDIPDDKPVAEWPIIACAAYVEGCDESYGEARAEAGMGAVSFGLDPYGAMMTIESPSIDPLYVAASKRLRDDRLLFKIELFEDQRMNPVDAVFDELPATPNTDNVPF